MIQITNNCTTLGFVLVV